MDIWNNKGKIFVKNEFLLNNPEYSTFLNKFEGDDWLIADLRNSSLLDGFAWGKFGPENVIKRHETDLIWVIKKKKKGFFYKLFGG